VLKAFSVSKNTAALDTSVLNLESRVLQASHYILVFWCDACQNQTVFNKFIS
jgi:hypothetical protein